MSERSRVQNYVIVPNFVEIARTAAEKSQFLDFSKWRPPLSWFWKFFIFQDGGRHHLEFLKFQNLTIGTVEKVELCQILSKSLKPRPKYVSFNIMLVWLKNAYSRPFWGFWGTFHPHDVTHRPNPKRTVLGLNHVIWAIKREYRSRGSSWALVREKKDRTGQEKSHKRVIFHLFWENVSLKRCTWKFV